MELSNWVVVFDLDDTLYSENDYFFSGLTAVEKFIFENYNIPFSGKLLEYHNSGVKDIFACACEEINVPMNVKESFLWTYRLHNPNIKLSEGIRNILLYLENRGVKICILTDGRSLTQRIKINTLSLNNYPLFISEEYNSEKPKLKRYLLIENLYPSKKYAYIGDNPIKDFKAPNELGWLSLGANWVPNKINRDLTTNSLEQPHHWLKNPSEITSKLVTSL